MSWVLVAFARMCTASAKWARLPQNNIGAVHFNDSRFNFGRLPCPEEDGNEMHAVALIPPISHSMTMCPQWSEHFRFYFWFQIRMCVCVNELYWPLLRSAIENSQFWIPRRVRHENQLSRSPRCLHQARRTDLLAIRLFCHFFWALSVSAHKMWDETEKLRCAFFSSERAFNINYCRGMCCASCVVCAWLGRFRQVHATLCLLFMWNELMAHRFEFSWT